MLRRYAGRARTHDDRDGGSLERGAEDSPAEEDGGTCVHDEFDLTKGGSSGGVSPRKKVLRRIDTSRDTVKVVWGGGDSECVHGEKCNGG